MRVVYAAIGASLLVVVYARLYQLCYRSYWTEAQALLNLWPFWTVAALLLFLGIYIGKQNDSIDN